MSQWRMLVSDENDFLWRTESIRAAVLRDDAAFFGQFLNLDQELRPGESGWTNMKISMPGYWRVESVLARDSRILLALSDGTQYALNRENVGELSYHVSNGGPGKSDEILERIWNEYARTR
jgi:hypothetical protein